MDKTDSIPGMPEDSSQGHSDTVEILPPEPESSGNSAYIPVRDYSSHYRPLYEQDASPAEKTTASQSRTDASEKYRAAVLLASEQNSAKKAERKKKIVFTAVLCAVCLVISCISGTLSAKIAISKTEKNSQTNTVFTNGSASSGGSSFSENLYTFGTQPDSAVSSAYTAPVSSGDNSGSAASMPQAVASTNAAVAKTAKGIYNDVVTSVVGITAKITLSNTLFGQSYVGESSGSGFIISDDGYILTNYHVVEGGSDITISFYDGEKRSAQLVGYDSDNDVAVLKTDATGLNEVKLGDSDELGVGDTVLIIGNPLGKLSYTLTSGVVSAVNRVLTDDSSSINMFQTDAAINSGNSGGPAFNMDGEVVGIATSKYADSTIEGLSFCIPIDDVKDIVTDIILYGYAKNRPSLSVSVQTLSAATAARYGLTEGVYIVALGEGGAGQLAGLQNGDVITAINSEPVKTVPELKSALKQYKAGSHITLTVFRTGQTLQIELTCDEKKPEKARTSYSNVFDL